ncbi:MULTISPECIES: hypothetical protein [Natrialbaceae]|uniref:DNA primase/polymerase bifunctional N-terminal domain-containing protein n=1 Tax=Halosolutus amylolyticus TaxID=2932267 RepID=A0ABD5PR85_9EURY|nr:MULTISPECIES: hypothetical protein [Natrialbaceae]
MQLQESEIASNELLHSLKQRDRWACFNADKEPIDPASGRAVDVLKTQEHHMSYQEAQLAYADHEAPEGVGFAMGLDDELVLIDLDDCLDNELRFTNDASKDIFTTVNSYTEVSVGGHGLHILASGYNLESEYGHAKNFPVELFDGQKFFTFTGRHIKSPHDVQERASELATIHRRYSPWVSYKEWLRQKDR